MHLNTHTVEALRWLRRNPSRRKDMTAMLDILKAEGKALADLIPALDAADCPAVITAALSKQVVKPGKAVQVL